MTSEQIAELRRSWAPTVAAQSEAAKDVMRLLDEREALLTAAKEAADGFDVVAADDMRLLALLRDAIVKAES